MMNQNQILFHSGNCLNLKKPYPRECRLCIQFCPHGAINEIKNIDQSKCTECGVCMTVCPSDGFVDRDMDNLGKYLLEGDRITLHCPLAKPEGYEISCLGMLDRDVWTTIMLLADLKQVNILTGDCGSCDDRQACAVSVALLKELLQEWKDHPQIKIEIMPWEGDSPEKGDLNNEARNQGLAGWREKGKTQIKNIFPGLEAEVTYHTPKSRQWFAKSLQMNPDKKIPYKAVKANENCTSCGVCTKICPQEALQQIQKEGKNRLIYEPSKCVQCNRCVEICGPEALRFEYVDFSYRFLTGKILLIETIAKYCAKCGKQIFHNAEPQLCMACAAQDPDLKGVLY
ncbi:MAG: 4Fe-4S binding protein [Peptococcaceae bacterium]|nr:4Fe-4S binding protein [Peptococcaceae bacterium]